MSQLQTLPRLMLVTDRRRLRRGDLVSNVVAAVEGGVGIVQFREPGLPDRELCGVVGRVRALLSGDALLVVNGRPELAEALGTGLHLPARHAPIGTDLAERFELRGRSAHDAGEVGLALAEGVSYLILGPIHPTPAKPGHPGSGVGLLHRVRQQAGPTPVYAIGGVTLPRIPDLLQAGAHGVAVCGAILGARDPARAAAAMACSLARGAAPRSRDP